MCPYGRFSKIQSRNYNKYTLTAHAKRFEQDPLVYELWLSKQPLSQPKQLNSEQKRSVDVAMTNKFQLIQGPPGNTITYSRYENPPMHIFTCTRYITRQSENALSCRNWKVSDWISPCLCIHDLQFWLLNQPTI